MNFNNVLYLFLVIFLSTWRVKGHGGACNLSSELQGVCATPEQCADRSAIFDDNCGFIGTQNFVCCSDLIGPKTNSADEGERRLKVVLITKL
jgi:hypothetical protein